MPNISLMTPEVESAIIRPSVLDIVHQLQDILKIPKDSKILYVSELESSYQRGSTMTQSNIDERDRTSFPYGNQITIEVDNTYNESDILSTAVRQVEHLSIFKDPNLGIIIKPIYSKNDFTITFKYRSVSVTEGKKWRDDIRMHISMMRDVNLHDITYHYLIPPEYIYILTELHRLRETVAPYNQSLETYLAAYATTKITAISNQTGTNVGLGVAETQMRIVGLYDFNIAPEKGARDGDASAWETSFTYKVSFSVPIAVNMSYPVMVHNQLLSSDYIDTTGSYNLDNHLKSYSDSFNYMSRFEANVPLDRHMATYRPIVIPSFDEFVPNSKPYGTQILVTALCSVDLADKKILLNLNELDSYTFDADVLEFIKSEYPYMTAMYKSILNIALYKWSSLMEDNTIYVDKDLNVKARNELSLRDNYRVAINIVTDLTTLDKAALERLKRFRDAARKLILTTGVTTAMLKLIANKVNLLGLVPDLPDVGISLRDLQSSYVEFRTVETAYVINRDGVRSDKRDQYQRSN